MPAGRQAPGLPLGRSGGNHVLVIRSLAAIVLLGLLGLHATSLDLALAPTPCEQDCSGDGPEGTCAPLCLECACCPTHRTLAQAEDIHAAPALAMLASEPEAESLPASAEPAEILHVPRPTLL